MRILFLLACLFGLTAASPGIGWWDQVRRGGNSFNRLPPTQAYFDAFAGHGGEWMRLTFTKWKGNGRDFLIGDADKYRGLPKDDLATLKAVLDRADKAGVKVVVTPLSLPWNRWVQQNGDKQDGRLWQDKARWADAARFWRDLAAELNDHPAVAAYNLINEPTPEREFGLPEHSAGSTQKAWYAASQGSAHDLPGFYRQVIAGIRSVDPHTPIMLDAGWYAAADAFYWPGPLEDPALLYAFHMYEPYGATSGPNLKRQPRPFVYPGKVWDQHWDAARVRTYLGLPVAWADKHGVARNRLVAGEFGCMRRLPFCPQYLEDVLTVLDEAKVHWAFYAFREDAWDGMDYELGAGPVDWRYWDAMEKGLPDSVARKPGPQFEPIRRRLQRQGG
jgi:sugar phosphate isomerase/epimerase